MTNKFRDALERIKNHTPKYGAFEDGFQSDADIAALEELVATLQDDAETIKALDEAGDRATHGRICSNDGNPYSEDDYSNILTSECCCGEGRFKFLNDSIFLARAANARPLFKKLAKLVKEGEK